MKKILIINLRRIGDVYTTGHLINSLNKNEDTSISLLVYKETAKAAVNLNNISTLFQIDRKEILTLKTNKLFSDGFALETLFNLLQEVKTQSWDEIINFSNDLVGANICSYLKDSTKKTIGVHFNKNRQVIPGGNWEILFNDVLPHLKFAPIHFVDCYHKMMGISANRIGQKLITNESHNTTALNSITSLRNNLSTDSSATKVIGIQLKTSDPAKDLPEKKLIELLRMIRLNSEFVPIILIAPTSEEREYAASINGLFDNDLIIVEADLQAISSVLLNIDLLITPDTAIKHIANLTETPVLEISLGHAPFLKQGSYCSASLILTDLITERSFNKNKDLNFAEIETNIQAQDILSSLMYFFAKTKSIRPRLSSDVTLYGCSFDQLGIRYSVIAGSVDASTEIHRLMSRQLINTIYDLNESTEIYNDIMDFGIAATTAWCSKEKSNITIAMKDLLGTLRALLQSQENRKSAQDFVCNLGKLITHCEYESIIQIPATIFKAKIELINAKTFDENTKEVEVLLYDLKSDIQKSLHCIKKLEACISFQKKEEFMNKPSEINAC